MATAAPAFPQDEHVLAHVGGARGAATLITGAPRGADVKLQSARASARTRLLALISAPGNHGPKGDVRSVQKPTWSSERGQAALWIRRRPLLAPRRRLWARKGRIDLPARRQALDLLRETEEGQGSKEEKFQTRYTRARRAGDEGLASHAGLSRQDCALPECASESALQDRCFVNALQRNIDIPFGREKPPSNRDFSFVRCGNGSGCFKGTVNLCPPSPLDGTKRGCQRTPAAILTLR